MEPFEVELDQKLLTVQPQEDGSYKIFDGINILGIIYPDILDNMQIKWSTFDLMSDKLAQRIGQLIEEKEM